MYHNIPLITQLHTSFLQENFTIVNFLQGGFGFLNIIFGCDNPTYYPSPGRGVIVCSLNPQEFTSLQDPSYHEKHCKGAYQFWLSL